MKRKQLLSLCLVCALGMGSVSYAAPMDTETTPARIDKEQDWETLKGRLDSYGGTWEESSYTNAVTDRIPETALLGNGDVGITSYGAAEEKTYLISKGDFWNAGDMVTSDPFAESDLTRRPLALGGLTIKENDDKENLSLTAREGVSVSVSSFHDNYSGEQAIDGSLEFTDTKEGWVSDMGQEGWIEIDLGEEQHIEKYNIYYYGALRSDRTQWNTRDYTVSFSKDGTEWETVEEVTGNTDNVRTFVIDGGIEARYMRIEVTHASQGDEWDARVRIPEIEVFSDQDDRSIFDEEENLSLTCGEGVTVTASSYHDNFTPESVVNGVISSSEADEEG